MQKTINTHISSVEPSAASATSQEPHRVLLYYKYVPLEQPEQVRDWQKKLCKELDLKGRILVSSEGLNGTVAGLPENTEKYKKATAEHPAFSDMEWKESDAEEQVFPRLRVVAREEIVTLGLKKKAMDVSLENKAHYIGPEELLRLYDQNEDFLILDARNEYEAKIGTFKNALVPPINTFREFPEFVKTIEDYKDKPIVTFCTGGVRCEKASAYLREQGFKNVRQLHGGIHVYAEKTGGKYFEGELFVFDKRLHMSVNKVNPSVIAKCQYCQQPVTRYVDCAEKNCGVLFNCCQGCETKHHGCCSEGCEQNHTKAAN
jgi:UPF0176 protein